MHRTRNNAIYVLTYDSRKFKNLHIILLLANELLLYRVFVEQKVFKVLTIYIQTTYKDFRGRVARIQQRFQNTL